MSGNPSGQHAPSAFGPTNGSDRIGRSWPAHGVSRFGGVAVRSRKAVAVATRAVYGVAVTDSVHSAADAGSPWRRFGLPASMSRTTGRGAAWLAR